MNDWDYIEDNGSDEWLEANDTGADWHAEELLVQSRWEEENDVETLLNNDPGYHEWSANLDAEADYERHIEGLAEMEAERHKTSLAIEAWDNDPRLGRRS